MGRDVILNSFTCLIFLGHIPGGRYRVTELGLLKNEAIVSPPLRTQFSWELINLSKISQTMSCVLY